MNIPVLSPEGWIDYQLLDTGGGRKFESFNGYKIIRPDPRAIWFPNYQNWDADAIFDRNSAEGHWFYKNQPPENWHIAYKNVKLVLKATDFRHVGVFPEQAVNWDYLAKKISGQKLKILNLFAYTGASTIAAVKEGAIVTHVDSSKGIISWAKENAVLSNLSGDSVRWIVEDCLKFVEREFRRGVKYEGVILDPPRFGHGSKGEVWKLQEDLSKLLLTVKDILSEDPKFVLLNLYTADLSAIAIKQLFDNVFKIKSEVIELAIKESSGERLLPMGITCRSI